MTNLFDAAGEPEVSQHLAACGACAAEFEQSVNALACVQPRERATASPEFKERVMHRLSARLAEAPPAGRNAPFLRMLIPAAVVLSMVLALPYLGMLGTNRGAVALLAQSVQAMNAVRSVHIVARMRTQPGDNFEFIGTQFEFQPVEMWKQFAPVARWRVENPGRAVVMDGQGSTLFIKPDRVVRGGRNAGFVEWLRPLLDPERVLATELRAAQRGDSHASIRQDGGRITLTSTRKAMGEFSNEWGRNSSIEQSDHMCVYRFDTSTGLLTGLQVIVQDGARDTVVFETVDILYNEAIPSDRFTLALPDTAISGLSPAEMPVNESLPATAREAAVTFLEGMAQFDWPRVLTVYPASEVPDGMRRDLGGLRILFIGEPFRSGLYPGWYVPYEIRLADGTHKKWNLAVRNDNPQHRWLQDGGI